MTHGIVHLVFRSMPVFGDVINRWRYRVHVSIAVGRVHLVLVHVVSFCWFYIFCWYSCCTCVHAACCYMLDGAGYFCWITFAATCCCCFCLSSTLVICRSDQCSMSIILNRRTCGTRRLTFWLAPRARAARTHAHLAYARTSLRTAAARAAHAPARTSYLAHRIGCCHAVLVHLLRTPVPFFCVHSFVHYLLHHVRVPIACGIARVLRARACGAEIVVVDRRCRPMMVTYSDVPFCTGENRRYSRSVAGAVHFLLLLVFAFSYSSARAHARAWSVHARACVHLLYRSSFSVLPPPGCCCRHHLSLFVILLFIFSSCSFAFTAVLFSFCTSFAHSFADRSFLIFFSATCIRIFCMSIIVIFFVIFVHLLLS